MVFSRVIKIKKSERKRHRNWERFKWVVVERGDDSHYPKNETRSDRNTHPTLHSTVPRSSQHPPPPPPPLLLLPPWATAAALRITLSFLTLKVQIYAPISHFSFLTPFPHHSLSSFCSSAAPHPLFLVCQRCCSQLWKEAQPLCLRSERSSLHSPQPWRLRQELTPLHPCHCFHIVRARDYYQEFSLWLHSRWGRIWHCVQGLHWWEC